MIRGVGVLRTMRGKDSGAAEAISKLAIDHVAAASKLASGAPARATMVKDSNNIVVLVEEWLTLEEHNLYTEKDELEKLVAPLVSEPPTCEFFPEALHICKGTPSDTTDVGILVRQKTNSMEDGIKLRDVQKAAYERQMQFEPGCTCCIILGNDSEQVKIIELWKTMQDFYFHENSEWHAQGEAKVVPLVIDMDCDFIDGTRII